MTTKTSRTHRRRFVRCMAALLLLVVALPMPMLRPVAPVHAASTCLGWTSGGTTYTTRRIQYTSDGILHLVGCNETFTLTDILNADNANTIVGSEPANFLQLVDSGQKIWMLNIPLSIEEGATLNLIGGSGDVNWLRLKSGTAGIIWIRTINGTILIQNSRVSSWNPTTGTYDTTTAGAPGTDEAPGGGTKPRSFIFARSYLVAGRAWNPPTSCGSGGGGRDYYEARMDVINSQIDHLGYHGSEAYGASWKVATNDTSLVPPNSRELYNRADVFGTIQNSTFTQNYFGAYTFGGYCMNVSGNHFDNNYWYGLDPHDDTDFMTVSGNTFTGNAGHGFICSIYCDHLVVQNNTATNNGRNGYMIHRRVDGAVITGNTGSGNGDSGLAVFDSYNASVSNNRFENNANAQIRLSVGASNNLFENNTLTGGSTSGNDYVIYTFTGTDTPTEGGSSRIQNNTFRGNTITGSASPVLKLSSATGNLIEGNTITAGSSLTTYEFADGQGNIVRNNTASGTTTINTFRSSTSNPAASSRLEDSPIEKSIVVKHSPSGSASTTVTDSRSYLASGMTMTAAPTGTSGTLTSSSTTITPRDFTIKPAKSSVAVSISTWNTSSPFAKSWTETASSSPGSVIHGVGNLQASTCYEVKAGSTVVGRFTATGSGSAARIDFTFSGTYPSGSALTFTVDSTTATCTNPGTVTPTATAGTATPSPTATGTPGSTSTVFSDGFESGIMGAWSTVSGITVQQSVVHAGSFAARANGSGTAAYARRSLSTPRPDLYYRVRFNIASKSTIAYLMRFRTASNGDMLGINVNSSGKLAIYNRTTGTTTTSTVSVSNGSWHEIQVHANQATGVVELWFDGTLVPALSFAQSLGSTPIGVIELGEPSSGRTFDISYDDVLVSTSFISTTPPTATPGPTGTATQTPTATATGTPAGTATATRTPTATATQTTAATATSTTAVTSTNTPAPTATTAPPTNTPVPAPVAFTDGFESGSMGNWPTVNGIVVQQSVVYAGGFAAQANGSGTVAYARRPLAAPQAELYYRIRFNIASKSTIAYLMRFRTAWSGDMLGVNVTSAGKLATYNKTTATTTASTITVTNGAWHELQVHVNQATGQVEVWYDGTLVPALSFSQSLGSSAVGVIELGEGSTGRTFNIYYDDIAVDSAFIASTFQPVRQVVVASTETATPTSTPAPLPSKPPQPTATPTSTAAPTVIPEPTVTPTGTPIPTDTPGPPASPSATATE